MAKRQDSVEIAKIGRDTKYPGLVAEGEKLHKEYRLKAEAVEFLLELYNQQQLKDAAPSVLPS